MLTYGNLVKFHQSMLCSLYFLNSGEKEYNLLECKECVCINGALIVICIEKDCCLLADADGNTVTKLSGEHYKHGCNTCHCRTDGKIIWRSTNLSHYVCITSNSI